jgi:hypothetical protein
MTQNRKTDCLAVNMPEKCKVINGSNYADGWPQSTSLTALLQIDWILRNSI